MKTIATEQAECSWGSVPGSAWDDAITFNLEIDIINKARAILLDGFCTDAPARTYEGHVCFPISSFAPCWSLFCRFATCWSLPGFYGAIDRAICDTIPIRPGGGRSCSPHKMASRRLAVANSLMSVLNGPGLDAARRYRICVGDRICDSREEAIAALDKAHASLVEKYKQADFIFRERILALSRESGGRRSRKRK